MIDKTAVFCIPVKNESSNIKSLFKTLDDLTNSFQDYFIIFVESDSIDNSNDLINQYLHNKKGILLNKSLKDIKNRVARLAISRNEYLKYIKQNKRLLNFDFLIVLDCGGVNNNLNKKKLEKTILKNNEFIGIFPNQSIFYYDIWTLRIKNIINYDCFEELFKVYHSKEKNIKKKFFQLIGKFMFINFFLKKKQIKVISAYGGIAIYKLNKVIEFSYDSNNGKNCEHVEFNKKICNKYGECLIIDKNFTNSYGINIHTINILLCSFSNFFTKKFIKKIICNF
tara:strand:+ start:5964 stop:6809 length:846 start_codon:yes stop_codon:yes gene_type:complete